MITIMLACAAIASHAQDVIKLKDTEPFNCKIVSKTNSEIQFIKKGDTTMSLKKAPMFLVEYFKYNESVVDVPKSADNIVDSVGLIKLTQEQLNELITQNKNTQMTISDDYKSKARTSFVIASASAAGSSICGLALLFLQYPQEPNFSSMSTADIIRISDQYKRDVLRYHSTVRVLSATGILLGAVAIITTASGCYDTLKYVDQNKGGISLSATQSGMGISFRW